MPPVAVLRSSPNNDNFNLFLFQRSPWRGDPSSVTIAAQTLKLPEEFHLRFSQGLDLDDRRRPGYSGRTVTTAASSYSVLYERELPLRRYAVHLDQARRFSTRRGLGTRNIVLELLKCVLVPYQRGCVSIP